MFPEMSGKAVQHHRQRQKRQGLTRVEVTVPGRDAALLRDVAKALRNPKGAAAARAFIRMHLVGRTPDFKEFLASAPLEGVDLTRPLDFGRDVEL
jgi:hypothetical protein